jgi:Protein of unknown function (DUF3079)
MAKKFPIHPAHPERICWGCDKYCPVNDMCCGNGSDRAQHPVELFGDDWLELLNGDADPPQAPNEPEDACS